jgi:putative membrane protein
VLESVIVVLRSDERAFRGEPSRRDRWLLPGVLLVSVLVVLGVGLLLVGRQAESGGAHRASALPAINAFLNGTSALLLAAGYHSIRRKRVTSHKICMGTAFGVSCLFLSLYLLHHYQVGSVPFTGQGWIRPIYFALLISHIVLAALVVPLALTTLSRALSGQFEKHRRVARWALPIWFYVSVTGIVVYLMLYRLYPGP